MPFVAFRISVPVEAIWVQCCNALSISSFTERFW